MSESPLSLQDVIFLATSVGLVLAVANYYSKQFQNVEGKIFLLEKRDIEYHAQLARLEEKLQDLKDWAELASRGNLEAVQHARGRFASDMRVVGVRLQELNSRVESVQTFLAKTSDFKIRGQNRND